jgi:hypothetical protein
LGILKRTIFLLFVAMAEVHIARVVTSQIILSTLKETLSEPIKLEDYELPCFKKQEEDHFNQLDDMDTNDQVPTTKPKRGRKRLKKTNDTMLRYIIFLKTCSHEYC